MLVIDGWYLPAGQSVQAARPVSGAYLPYAHTVQLAELYSLVYSPAPHRLHDALASRNLPGSQAGVGAAVGDGVGDGVGNDVGELVVELPLEVVENHVPPPVVHCNCTDVVSDTDLQLPAVSDAASKHCALSEEVYSGCPSLTTGRPSFMSRVFVIDGAAACRIVLQNSGHVICTFGMAWPSAVFQMAVGII